MTAILIAQCEESSIRGLSIEFKKPQLRVELDPHE